MRKTKQLTSLILCAFLAASALVSCNSGNSSTNGGDDIPESEIVNEITLPISEDGAAFDMWVIWSNTYIESLNENTAVQLMAEKTGVTINYTCIPTEAGTENSACCWLPMNTPI